MSLHHRRVVKLSVTALIIFTVVLLANQQQKATVWMVRVTLGLRDQQPTDWSGQIDVAGGEVTGVEGWRFEEGDKVEGLFGWTCSTHNHVSYGQRTPVQLANGKPRVPEPEQPWPNGVTITVKGHAPAMTVKLKSGELKIDLTGLKTGEPLVMANGAVTAERLPQTSIPRPAPKQMGNVRQDDYPAFWVHYKSGKQYLAWVSYQHETDRVLMAERDGPDGAWSDPKEIAAPGYHFRVQLATTHAGKLWIVWSEMVKQNWDLYARPYQDGQLGEPIRLSDDAGPDIWHRMTTDNKGRAWVVWQGFRKGRSQILARCCENDKWSPEIQVSSNEVGNCWDPCIAADPTGDRVWIGWDEYHRTTYNVVVTALENGPDPKHKELMMVEGSPLFQAHLSLACDKAGRVWTAWDESGPQWGKDSGFEFGGENRPDTSRLYSSRAVRVKVLENGKWVEPKAGFASCLPEDMREYNELPQLQPDSDGRMWLGFRHRTCRKPREDGWAIQGRWDVFVTAYLGDHWLAPTELPGSGGRNDMRTASQRDSEGSVYFAFASDNRGWQPPGMGPKNHQVAVTRVDGAAQPSQMQLVAKEHKYAEVPLCHPDEANQVKRIRNYAIEHAGKTYHIYRGDLHRHTDISGDGVGDGSLMDLHRYALDAAAFDFIMVTDHNMGGDNEYCWWRTQQSNDLYTVPGSFISMYGYERSVPYPNGHRNVIWTERGHRTLPLPKVGAPAGLANDTAKLYDYLRATGGICTLHTSATSQGTDWKDPHDPELEPFVELFQGYHANYEAPDAPKVVTDKTDRIHGKFEPAGFVSLALVKGYKLGFQSSSDHISTHVSYACILAEEFSRKGLVDAMKKRHTYAATDNIVLDVRSGSAIMGDEVKADKPKFDVIVLGTGPLAKVEVLRNSEVVHSAKLDTKTPAEARFSWHDIAPPATEKQNYYYVRVIQENGQMAWSSPIWVEK